MKLTSIRNVHLLLKLWVAKKGSDSYKNSPPAPSFQVKCPKEIALNDENKFENDFHSIILYSESENNVNSCLFGMFTSIHTPFCLQEKVNETARDEMNFAHSIFLMVK